MQETGTLVLRSSNVKNGEIIDADNVYVNDRVVTTENVQEGDIVVVVRNGSRALIGKHAQIKTSMPNTVIGAFMSGIRSEHSSFVNALLDTVAFESEIAKNMGATINQITGYMFSKMEFRIPSGKEQERIGEYFQSLDHLITLHHRKLNSSSKRETFAWEQRKFNEFVKNVAKKNKDNLDLEPFAVTNDRGFIAQKDAHEDFGYMKDTDRRAYNIVPPNSFAYNPARINVGSLGYYAGTENVIVSSLYEVFQTEDFIDDRFLWHWLKSEHFPKWIEKLQEGSVRLYFYFDKLIQCQMMIPSVEEQKIISEYLDRIDTLITLHQRKCDETKKLKKYMLQKMFPQNGNKVPEIRFFGFTDDWEQRKFGEMASSFEYGLNAAAKEYDGENKYIRITDIDDNTHEFLSDSLTSPDIDLTDAEKYKLSTGDILFARTGASVGKSYIYRDYDGLVYYAGFLIRARIKDEYDVEFVFQNTLTDKYNKYIAVTSQRSGQPGVNAQEYSEFKIQVPKKEEQIKIGKYFQNLDHLITLHHRKYEELQKIKKFMLQNMFV